MIWNYRVIVRDRPGTSDASFGIPEVYYDEQGRVRAWSEDAVSLKACSVEGLVEEIDLLREALDKPILSERELLRQVAERGTTNQGDSAKAPSD